MTNHFDSKLFKKIQREIEASLHDAAFSLEVFVQDNEHYDDANSFVDAFHDIQGALVLLEIDGAITLVEEMLAVAQAFTQGAIAEDKTLGALESLVKAMSQLPNYLHMVRQGTATPLLLQPSINALRRVMGKASLSETAFVQPTESIIDESLTTTEEISPDEAKAFEEKVREIRTQYQKGLVKWFSQNSLEEIKQALAIFEQSLSRGLVHEIFHLARVLLEALSQQEAKIGRTSKLIFGRLDRLLGQIASQGLQTVDNKILTDLRTAMLYHLSYLDAEIEDFDQIKQQYGLTHTTITAADIDQLRAQLDGSSSDVIDAVHSALNEEVGYLRESLETLAADHTWDKDKLAPLLPYYDRLANILRVLAYEKASDQVMKDKHNLLEFAENPSADIEDALSFTRFVPVIERLLNGAEEEQLLTEDNANLIRLTQHEKEVIFSNILAEVKSSLYKINDAISELQNTQSIDDNLSDASELLKQIAGALDLLTYQQTAAQIKLLQSSLAEILHSGEIPSEEWFEIAADSLISFENILDDIADESMPDTEVAKYLDASIAHLEENRKQLVEEDLLNMDIQLDETPDLADVIDLRQEPSSEPPPFSDEEFAQLLSELPKIEDTSLHVSSEQQDETESADELSADQEFEQLLAAIPEAEETEDHEQVLSGAKSVTPAATEMDEEDQELLEIFIEEAEEAVETIGRALAKWLDNDDEEAIAEMRRAFHTLKGSGRMAGATSVGELAWAVENMLNKVISGEISRSVVMADLLQFSHALLPEMLEAFRQQDDHLSDGAEGVIETASFLANAGKTDVDDTSDDGFSSLNQQKALEATLYEIYDKETKGHLEQLRLFIESCLDEGGSCLASENLVRTLHTLHGSSHMAGVNDIAELSEQLEDYVEDIRERGVLLSDTFLNLLADASYAIMEMLPKLLEDGAELKNKMELLQRLEDLSSDKTPEIELMDISFSEQDEVEEQPAIDESIESTPEVEETASSVMEPVATQSAASLNDVDDELAEIFIEEADEILEQTESLIQHWREEPQNAEIINGLKRQLHTLKGGARMASILPIADMSHAIESLMTAISEGRIDVAPEIQATLEQSQGSLIDMVQGLRHGQPVTQDSALLEKIERLSRRRSGIDDSVEAVSQISDDIDLSLDMDLELDMDVEVSAEQDTSHELLSDTSGDTAEEARSVTAVAETNKETPMPAQQEQVRVRGEQLDKLIRYAGEISVNSSAFEQHISGVKNNVDEMTQTVERLKNQLRQLEIEAESQIHSGLESASANDADFDPLEFDKFSQLQTLSRSMLESLSDLENIENTINTHIQRSELAIGQQSRINKELHDNLLRTRMVPFSSVIPRLRRVVMQAADELNKPVDFHTEGVEQEIDSIVLGRMLAPIEHILRNAVAHGIEMKELRSRAGKSEKGHIGLSLRRDSTGMALVISDDGGGLDTDAIRGKAIVLGVLDKNAPISDEDAAQLILESGLSTAETLTQISGRGVGMDVVNNEIKNIGGSLHIATKRGRGTSFTLHLPLRMSLIKSLLVEECGHIYAIPIIGIDGIEHIEDDTYQRLSAGNNTYYEWHEDEYLFTHLSTLLDQVSAPSSAHKHPLILMRVGEYRIALSVNSFLGNQEVVVKQFGPQLDSLRIISGGTVLSDGRMALILDMNTLVRDGVRSSRIYKGISTDVQSEQRQSTIMVIDDSITVRKVSSRFLKRNDLNVITAKDGIEAIALLEEYTPDLMMMDIEMPNMNGYDLLQHVRADERLKDIPVIMITSRTGTKHRDKALELGANDYFGKPYQEELLLDKIHELLTVQ